MIRASARIENAIRSDRYPTISTFAEQDITPNNRNNNSGSNNNGNGNNHPRRREHSKPAVAFIDSSTA